MSSPFSDTHGQFIILHESSLHCQSACVLSKLRALFKGPLHELTKL